MLTDDVATHLATYGALSDGSTTYTVCKNIIPDTPDAVVVLLSYPAGPPIRAMGASLAAPLYDRHLLSVITRGPARDYASTATIASTVHARLDFLHATLSTRKYSIKALTAPSLLEQDRNSRWKIEATYMVEKERG